MVKEVLNEKWIKASIIGTLWAASEIVLGSFFHNLRIPFSSNLLTAIGIIILISVSYIWTEKGLFWRAGLICAIMKTMSPSAVIFGPMIAIFSEAVLLEVSVRLLGKTIPGYILGAMLAMSWNLFQKIANFIIFYGFNIIDLYTSLIKFAQKQLMINSDMVWALPIFLLILYCILGFITALIGIKTGRNLLKQPAGYKSVNTIKNFTEKKKETKPEFNYSIIWLTADIILIIASLVMLNFTTLIYWSLAIIGVVTLWAFRYKRALRQLSKPKFWIFFVLITMISAFVFTKVMSVPDTLQNAFILGLQMNFRAVIIIVGFSVLGTELYNPVIRDLFLRTSFKQLPLALELSFESLPLMIANIPDFKTISRNPVLVFHQVISQVDFRLAEIKTKIEFNRKIFILTGKPEQGKTTLVQNIIPVLKKNGISVGGIYSPRIMQNNKTIGYDIVNIVTNEREIFLRQTEDGTLMKIGRFSIFPAGLQKGNDALKLSFNSGNRIVIIDEVGLLELKDQGWAAGIQELVSAARNHILLVVRDIYVEKVIQKWDFRNVFVIDINTKDHIDAGKFITEQIN